MAYVGLTAALLVSTILSTHAIGRAELWRDELASWTAARRSTADLLALTQNIDASTFAYYFLLHHWMRLAGDSPVALRAPSAMAAVATVALVWLIAQRVSTSSAANVAALLVAICPATVRYAQEARPYALVTAVAAGATYLLLRNLWSRSVVGWIAYAVLIAATGWLSAVALAILASHALLLLLVAENAPWRRFLLSAGAGVSGALPLLVVAIGQAGAQIRWPRPTPSTLGTMPEDIFFSAAFGAAICIALLVAVAGSDVTSRRLALAATAPAVLVLLVSFGPHSYWVPRYLLFAVPLLLVAAGTTVAGSARLAAVALLSGAVFAAPSLMVVWQPDSHDWWDYPFRPAPKEPIRYSAAARVVLDNAEPGDHIVYTERDASWMVEVGFAYWSRHERGVPHDVLVTVPAEQAGSFWAQTCDVVDCATRLTARRVWVVGQSSTSADFGGPMDVPLRVLAGRGYSVVNQWRPSGVRVALLQQGVTTSPRP